MRNEENAIKLNRNELYELVWKTPLIKLSKDYNLSDVGLSKICKRHQIPTPPAGYWAKIANGHAQTKTPLPETSDKTIEVIEIFKKNIDINNSVNEKYSNVFKEFGTVQNTANPFESIKSLNDLHPIVKNTFQQLKSEKPDDYSRLVSYGENTVDVRVSKTQLERAMRFIHALFKFIERQGFSIISKKENNDKRTYVVIHGVEIQIRLTEKVDRQLIDQSKIKPGTYYWGPKYTYQPTGQLFLRIENIYVDYIRKEWRDGQNEKIEDKIVEIVEGILYAAIKDRIKHLEWKEEEDRRAEQEKIRKEREAALQRERHKREKLFSEAQNWNTSQNLRQYIDAAVKHHETAHGPIERDSEFDQWLQWAIKQANELDPLTKSSNLSS
jgi:hypothetical protein